MKKILFWILVSFITVGMFSCSGDEPQSDDRHSYESGSQYDDDDDDRDHWITCTLCKGDGVCFSCHGDGVGLLKGKYCKYCDGTGICHMCHGSGKLNMH